MKLLGKKFSINKGFTLIELLVVIAVLGVLAAGVLTAINPLKKINQAKDANAKNDVAQVVQAAQAYFTANSGLYPADTATFTSSGEIKTFPSSVTYVVSSDKSAAAAYAQSNVDTTKYFCWDSTISSVKDTTTSAPTAAATTCN
ncbi:MAG: type II secretion system protein [Candidatus Levybacteria bacterium]|nr:type II secretion system protein [Candidatus Levybacteria bacterium]